MSLTRLHALEQSTSRLHVDLSRLLQLSADHGDHISELHDNLVHTVSKKELEVAVGTSNYLIQTLHEKVNRLFSGQEDQNENLIESHEIKNMSPDNSIIMKHKSPKEIKSTAESIQSDINLLKKLEYLENELNDAKSQIFHLNNKVHQLEHNVTMSSLNHHNTAIGHHHGEASVNHFEISHNMKLIGENFDHNGSQEHITSTNETLASRRSNTDGPVFDYSPESPKVLKHAVNTDYVNYIDHNNVESDSIESVVNQSIGTNSPSKELKNGLICTDSIDDTVAFVNNANGKVEYDNEHDVLHEQSEFSKRNSLVDSATVVSMQADNVHNDNDKLLAIEAIIAANRRRLELYGIRTDKIQNNVKLMDAEHSALLLSHKNLMNRFTDSEAAIFAILDKLMKITDSNQANAERQELHAIEQAKQIKSAMEKINVLTKRMNNPHLNNFGNLPIVSEQTRRSSAAVPMLGLPELIEFDDEPANSNNTGDGQVITSIELNRIKAQIKELGEHQIFVADAVKLLNEKLLSIANSRHLPGNRNHKSGMVATNLDRLDLSSHPDIIDLRNDVDVLKRRMVLLPKQIYHQLFHEEIHRQNEKITALKVRSDQTVTVKPPVTPYTNKSKYLHARSKLSCSNAKNNAPSNMTDIDNSHRLVEAPILPISSKIRKLIEKQHNKRQQNEDMVPTRPLSTQNYDEKLERFYLKLDNHGQLENENKFHWPARSSGDSEYGEIDLDDIFTRSVYEDEDLDEFDPSNGYPENSLYTHGQFSNVDGTISEITFTEMDMLHELSTALTSSVQSSSKS